MNSTLIVNGKSCKTIVIEGKWYVIVGEEPQRLYKKWAKNRSLKAGGAYLFQLKCVCVQCNKEFYGRLDSLRKYCSKSCWGKQAVLKSYNKWDEGSYPKHIRLRANSFINSLIKRHRIFAPKVCSNCEVIIQVHAHHPDYSKPNEVMWLCRSCHRKIHFGNKEIKGELIAYAV